MQLTQPSVYSAEDQQVWNLLYTRQVQSVEGIAYAAFNKGLKALAFEKKQIPLFDEINEQLNRLTGWTIYPVPGLIDNRFFFEQMMERRFGSTQWLRNLSQLDYLEEPDMFHDVFGHIPLLTDPDIAEFLEGLARIAGQHLGDENIIEEIARVYWYTIEFGLVKEGHLYKIYGAGILSSIGESKFCLSVNARRVDFHLDTVLQTPYIKDKFQEQYFVLRSMKELKNIIRELDTRYENKN